MPKKTFDIATNCSYNNLEWDHGKSIKNQDKHGVSFESALHVFSEPYLEIPDKRKNYGEDRYVVIGNYLGRIVILVYTPRNDKKRIISLRKANEREQKIYKERLKTVRCNS